MRILIDECLDWRLSRGLADHFAVSAQKMGWSGIQNGELLKLAVSNGFDVLLTADQNLKSQQNVSKYPIAIVVLRAESVQLQHTLPLMPKVIAMKSALQPGTIHIVSP